MLWIANRVASWIGLGKVSVASTPSSRGIWVCTRTPTPPLPAQAGSLPVLGHAQVASEPERASDKLGCGTSGSDRCTRPLHLLRSLRYPPQVQAPELMQEQQQDRNAASDENSMQLARWMGIQEPETVPVPEAELNRLYYREDFRMWREEAQERTEEGRAALLQRWADIRSRPRRLRFDPAYVEPAFYLPLGDTQLGDDQYVKSYRVDRELHARAREEARWAEAQAQRSPQPAVQQRYLWGDLTFTVDRDRARAAVNWEAAVMDDGSDWGWAGCEEQSSSRSSAPTLPPIAESEDSFTFTDLDSEGSQSNYTWASESQGCLDAEHGEQQGGSDCSEDYASSFSMYQVDEQPRTGPVKQPKRARWVQRVKSSVGEAWDKVSATAAEKRTAFTQKVSKAKTATKNFFMPGKSKSK